MLKSLNHAVIRNPMDFQTMLKKAKQKHHKSKQKFKDLVCTLVPLFLR